ncbi:MAG: hypothetical protein QJR04_25105 [Burkholderia multivorans]|nr:hypothetical protein [Burkholderia multivorans]
MDDADRAQEQAELEMELRRRARKYEPTLKPCGACHFCSEPIADARLFCDADCRDDYERMKRAEVRNGRVIYDDDQPNGLSADLSGPRLEDLL